ARPGRDADGPRARDPPAARRRHVERRRRGEALHLAGDSQEPRPPHPHEARGGHPDARCRDRTPGSDHRLAAKRVEDRVERLIAAEQDERRRIALFLHDGPVQQLSGIALMLDAAQHSIAQGKTEEARDIIAKALERHRETIRELRDLSFALEPVILRDQGFTPALQALVAQVGETHSLRIDLSTDGTEELGETAQVALYT